MGSLVLNTLVISASISFGFPLPPAQDEPVVSASTDGRFCAYALEDTLIGYDLSKQEELWRRERENLISTLVFSPSGNLLAVSGYGWTIEVHDALTGKLLKTLKGPMIHPVTCLAFSPDGKQLVSGSSVEHSKGNDAVVIWSVEKGEHSRVIEGHGLLRIYAVAFTNDGKQVVIASNLEDILLVDVATGDVSKTMNVGSKVTGLSISSDGKYVIAACENLGGVADKEFKTSKEGYGTLQLWDTTTWKRLESPHTRVGIVSAKFVHKDKRLAYSDGDSIFEYDLETKERTFNRSFPWGWVASMDTHPSANKLLIAGRPGGMFFLDCDSHSFRRFIGKE